MTAMDDLSGDPRVVEFREDYRSQVIDLWKLCELTRPWNDPDKDIDRKLLEHQGRFFVVLSGEKVIASVMVGYDGHRGWINYLAVDPAHQGLGLGRKLMEHCEAYLLALGCPKVNLMVRRGNDKVLAFYDSLDYAEDAAVPLGKRLIPDC